MFKVITLIVLIAGMIGTWTLLNSPAKMSTQLHAEIQSKLAVLIEETIKTKKPQSSDFQMNQMYTNALSDELVSAHFSYKFKDIMPSENNNAEGVEQSITGYALLAKTPSENSELQKWVIQSIKTNQESVSFSEGMTVTAGDTAAASESAPPPENK